MDTKIGETQALVAGSLTRHQQNFSLNRETASGRNLSSYRRSAFPTRATSSAGSTGQVLRGGEKIGNGGDGSSFGLFRKKVGGGQGGGASVVGGGGAGAIGVEDVATGQSVAALRRTGGVFSPRFLSDNPLLADGPRALPSLEAASAGGGVLGLPNGEVGGGGLSADLLRALQKYRVAAEVQG